MRGIIIALFLLIVTLTFSGYLTIWRDIINDSIDSDTDPTDLKSDNMSEDDRLLSNIFEGHSVQLIKKQKVASLWSGAKDEAVPNTIIVKRVKPPSDGQGERGHTILAMTDLQSSDGRDDLSRDDIFKSLEWLAAFHAHFWGNPRVEGLWPQGGYWHLDTRADEYASMPHSVWKENAKKLDAILKGHTKEGTRDTRFMTIIHGDMKAENVVFYRNNCAVCDFQYTGTGYGAVDIAYLLASSADRSLLSGYRDLLSHYHTELSKKLRERNDLEGDSYVGYTMNVLLFHFRVAMADWIRFMEGWGQWGNHRWAQEIGRQAIREINER
ncbi:DnaJ-like protein [Planoprotostelium fungivorum]|uniref:DnaJ-like protein n=1 Tax=Planoprotostelium fungivorum TaxID=1890364 RepID=A0A2P6NPG3_9EUKA|nr:DnaJ-like protein [Planoprotostelium fungivorum]